MGEGPPGCSVLKTFPADSPYNTPAKRHFESIYSQSGYAPMNSQRQNHFFQIVFLIARYPDVYGGGRLPTGWGIITMLYQAARQLNTWAASSTTWNSKRKLLGMDLFPRTGASNLPYGFSEDVRSIVGNDFMVRLIQQQRVQRGVVPETGKGAVVCNHLLACTR